MCLEQIRYSGIFDAVDICKRGHRFRFTHAHFLDLYWVIDPAAADLKNLGINPDPRILASKCRSLVESLVEKNPDLSKIMVGKNLVMYKDEESLQLQKLLHSVTAFGKLPF